jgi:hypothetical protein
VTICAAFGTDAAWNRSGTWVPPDVWLVATWVVYAGYLIASGIARLKATTTSWLAIVVAAATALTLYA